MLAHTRQFAPAVLLACWRAVRFSPTTFGSGAWLVAGAGTDPGHTWRRLSSAARAVGICARVDSCATAATLWRHGLRLGAAGRYDQRHGELAVSAPGHISFRLSADRSSGVSGDDGSAPHRVREIYLHRYWLGQGTHAADGVGVSVPENYRCRIDPGTAPCGCGERGQISAAFASSGSAALRATADRAQPVTLGQRSSQQVRPIETLCMDARNFIFPETPLVVYLFNPLPEAALRQVMRNLEQSFERAPRPVWLVYHNPVLEFMLMQSPSVLVKEVGKPEYSIFRMTSKTVASRAWSPELSPLARQPLASGNTGHDFQHASIPKTG